MKAPVAVSVGFPIAMFLVGGVMPGVFAAGCMALGWVFLYAAFGSFRDHD